MLNVLDMLWAVGGGVLTAIFIWIWDKAIIPALISRFRDDTHIAGEWIWYENDSDVPVGKMLISQSGARVKGTLTRNTSYSGSAIERVYEIDGTIHHDHLLLNFFEKSDRRRRGVIALVVSQVRSVMYGRNAYIAIGENLPVSDLYVFMESGKDELSAKEALDFVKSKATIGGSHAPIQIENKVELGK